jgi:lysine-specific demethylase 8
MSSGSFDKKAAASEAVAVGTAAPAPPAAPPLPPPPQQSQSLASLLAAAERASEPAVFRGALTDWPPARRWGGGARGLEYLKAAAGGATVRAMRSKGPLFYGELGAHAPVELPLGAVADAALAALLGSEHGGDGGSGDAEFLYVAQQPLPKCDGGSSDEAGLAALARDAAPPAALLGARDLASANLWLSPRAGRSSLHYDPHHGLLAVVAGAKTVTLLRPDAAIGLSPRSVRGLRVATGVQWSEVVATPQNTLLKHKTLSRPPPPFENKNTAAGRVAKPQRGAAGSVPRWH